MTISANRYRWQNLKAMLEKWLPNPALMPQSADTTGLSDASVSLSAQNFMLESVDVRVLAALVGDDPEVISDFLQDFRRSATQIAAELKTAYTDGQTKQVGALAHKLKFSARSVGALGLGELSPPLNKQKRPNNLTC